jgi:D-alanyl-D-alanine carboxypeptidase (penicillin-binding protein 5/6)
MRTPTALVAGALVCVLAVPASAAEPAVVGGQLLRTHGVVAAAGTPPLPATAAAGWLVADMDTGAVLAAKDPHGSYAPASTLKVLTAATLIPQLDPTALVQPTFADVNVEGSRVGLVQQMRYTVKDLFTAMLVVSGNDAANTLASANGGVAKTVAEMNDEARRLGALDTHAVNANGLDDPRQRTSPYDLALIGREAMRSVAFRGYVATKRYYLPAPRRRTIYLASHDKLLWNYPGAIGIKNGYTVKARATFVGAATRNGHTLIVTLLKTNPRYWPEAAALLSWGFAAEQRPVTPVGQLVDPAPVAGEVAPSPLQAGTAAGGRALAPRREAGGGGLPILPTLLVGSGVFALGGGLFRTRRSRRGPRKLSLPPL